MPLYVLDRNEGFFLNRAEVPWSSLVLLVQGLRDGVTLRGRVCVSAYCLAFVFVYMYFFSDVFLLYMSSAFVIISHTEEGACSPETCMW